MAGPGGGAGADPATGSVTVGDVRTDVVVTLDTKPPRTAPEVVRIDARLNATGSLRALLARPPGPQPPPAMLASSRSRATDMNQNPPVVIVRGSRPVFLTAATNPPGQLVTWQVAPNQTSRPPPTLDTQQTFGDSPVQLSTDTTGSFSVTAAIGPSAVVWNVILVGVDLDPATPAPVVRPAGLIDLNDFLATPEGKKTFGLGVGDTYDPTVFCGASSGQFAFGNHAFSSEVRVRLRGGGTAEDLGCDKVAVHVLQNLTDDRVAAEYSTQIAFTDNIAPVSYPVTDSSPGSPPGYNGPTIGIVLIKGAPVPQSPFLHSAGMFRVVASAPTARTLELGDSPAAAFRTREPRSGEQLTRLRGDKRFRVAVASFSTDAAPEIVVHADLRWLVDYTGDVSVSSGIGRWTAAGADVKVVQNWTPIRSSSGVDGTDAMNALLEVSKPLAIALQDAAKTVIPKP